MLLIAPANFEALIIPGGYAPDHMRRNPAMVAFVRDMDHEGKVVAAICHAGWMLGPTNQDGEELEQIEPNK